MKYSPPLAARLPPRYATITRVHRGDIYQVNLNRGLQQYKCARLTRYHLSPFL